ncbi:unnamed protein product [Toxocara canis]|uniref:Protein kinase domain-containing protein n=1 Tax=Toxocara canis TaxID=6265 RepID=A0A183UJT9_TOXCA|nr:unnamed protein product [Toxocara canis]
MELNAARLETRKMDYLNKLRSTVSSVAAQVSNALPGNPVTREYEILSQIASAGPGLSWKIYAGRKHSTKQAVAVWLFDKKDLDRWPRHEKELFTEVLRRGVAQLTRLRHPRILVIEHPLEESRDSFAFCTEPMFASLANCLGRHENLAPAIPTHLIDFEFVDVEIRHGLFQLAEALSFLHIDARMLHRNICPESVVINDRGAWKLAGFDFAVQATPSSSGQLQFEMVEWEERTMSLVQPSLDYLAPEYVLGGRCDTYADIFSLGVLSIAIFNHCRPPFEHRNSLENFRKDAEKLKALPASVLVNVPAEFREDVKMCLNFTPDLRPDATQFSKIVYFDNALTKTLNYFDSLCQMDNAQKMQFFKTLPQVLADFPKRPLLQKVLPYLSAEFSTPDLIPFILPSVFLIAELSSDSEFATVILPQLIPVFAMDRPYQIVLMLLQKMELLLQKTPDEDIRRHVLPLIYNAISSEVTRIQELCLSIIPNVGKLVDRDSMKTHLLPKLLRLAVEGGVLSVRVQALICLGKLMPTLEPWMVSDQILPALPKVNSKEPGVLMAILGIYKLAYEDARFGIAREQCAKSVLPFLIATSVENTLNLQQFEQFFAIINVMLHKVETEQRQRLQQLSASQEEQRNIPDFNEVLASAHTNKNTVSGSPNSFLSTHTEAGPLSLEEKKRLAAEQEQNVRMRTQPSILQPATSEGVTARIILPKRQQTPQRSLSPLDSLLDAQPEGSILSPSVTSHAQSFKKSADIDLSEFLPPSSNQTAVTKSTAQVSPLSGACVMNFPATPAFGATPSIEQQFGGSLDFRSGPTFTGLPQPPQSQNPVHRNVPGFGRGVAISANMRHSTPSNGKPDLSAFDGLLSFQKGAISAPMNSISKPSVSTMLPRNSTVTSEQKPKQVFNGKDPFADLFG